MNWTTVIVREAPDKLSKVEWVFTLNPKLDAVVLRLASYTECSRPSRRHEWVEQCMWLSVIRDYARRYNAIPDRPSPPDDVIAEARQRLNDALVIM